MYHGLKSGQRIYTRERNTWKVKEKKNRNNTVQQNGCECNMIRYLEQREKINE